MALQKRPPSADRQIERFAEFAEWNADDTLDHRGWAYQSDFTIGERLAGELVMSLSSDGESHDKALSRLSLSRSVLREAFFSFKIAPCRIGRIHRWRLRRTSL